MTVKVECSTCGKEVHREKNKVEKHDNHFCSKSCRSKFMKREIDVSCANCGTTITKTLSTTRTKSRHFCSPECKSSSMEEIGSHAEVTGDISEMYAAARLTEMGYTVSKPIGRPAYDLIAEKCGVCLKIQVKSTCGEQGKIGVWTKKGGGEPYSSEEVDYFVMYLRDLNQFIAIDISSAPACHMTVDVSGENITYAGDNVELDSIL